MKSVLHNLKMTLGYEKSKAPGLPNSSTISHSRDIDNISLSHWSSVLYIKCKIKKFLLHNERIPECVFCACPLTIRHVLLDCADLILLRQQYFNAVSMSDLFLNVDGQTILAFLKASGKARLL